MAIPRPAAGLEQEHLLQQILALAEQLPDQGQGALRTQVVKELITQLLRQGRLDEAQARFRALVEPVDSSTGAVPDVTHVAHELGAALAAAGRTREAATLYERVLAINETVVKTYDTDAARTLHNLAVLYDRAGHRERADRLWAKGRRRYESNPTPITKEKEDSRS